MPNIIHGDTRGCIFDRNGDKQDIIYNTETPKLCDNCKAEFKKRQVDENIIFKYEYELKKLSKPIIQKIEIFIMKYPLFSVLVSGLFAIALNIIASMIWEKIK